MTMTTHTPGPWHVNAIQNGRIVGDETAPAFDKLLICNTNATVATVYRGKDARLIAAAPEMLELLRELVIDHEGDCPALGSDAVGACDCVVGTARKDARALLARIGG